jgi:hypothetical protein
MQPVWATLLTSRRVSAGRCSVNHPRLSRAGPPAGPTRRRARLAESMAGRSEGQPSDHPTHGPPSGRSVARVTPARQRIGRGESRSSPRPTVRSPGGPDTARFMAAGRTHEWAPRGPGFGVRAVQRHGSSRLEPNTGRDRSVRRRSGRTRFRPQCTSGLYPPVHGPGRSSTLWPCRVPAEMCGTADGRTGDRPGQSPQVSSRGPPRRQLRDPR